jgi:hypothetical protein
MNWNEIGFKVRVIKRLRGLKGELEVFITDHLRDFASNLKKYKMMQLFLPPPPRVGRWKARGM